MEELLDAATVSKLVAAALQRLSANHREVIVLHYYDGLSVDEIAGIVRVGAGTVKSRLYYARESLRRLLPPDLNLER
jgi:RNA polymerase sigma-70 factor (ECF subfamily)